jgi:signal peptidase I
VNFSNVDFALVLFLLTLVTGVLWGVDRFYARPRRAADVEWQRDILTLSIWRHYLALFNTNTRFLLNDDAYAAKRARKLRKAYGDRFVRPNAAEEAFVGAEGRADIIDNVRRLLGDDYRHVRAFAEVPSPWWVEWGAAFFPVVLAVFALRSFVVEPFRIPSGSMIPTLLEGDFILVNKFNYGIRLPLIDLKIVDIGEPKRGEVMVFRYPVDPSQNYIKRVVGLPGDKIDYNEKRLTINGKPVETVEAGSYLHSTRLYYSPRYTEALGSENVHNILNEREKPPYVSEAMNFPFRDNCIYTESGFSCTVPPGHYLVMGDNRDNSADSRIWGFVPEKNIVGRAFFIWFNASDLRRVGKFH